MRTGAGTQRRRVWPLLLAAALAASPFAGAASPTIEQFSYMKSLKEAEARAEVPAVFAQLEVMEPARRAAFATERRDLFERVRTMRSLSGDATGAARASAWIDIGDRMPAAYATQSGEALAAATPEDAIEAIVREARKRRIVILNEAHHVPQGRVFAGKLARELRKIGYSYLAAEAFANDIPRHPKAVSRFMGFYVMEPMYAGFVRSAMQDGWSFVGYDHVADSAVQREIGAARNIVENIFARDPQARVFMYVGYGHASKQQVARKDGWKSVATLLREQLGTDPLTVDQVVMQGRGDARVDHPQYRAAVERFAPSKPIVLKAAAGGHVTVGLRPRSHDMQVVHPDETMQGPHGRPLWMERQAGLRPHPVPAGLLPASGRRLIQAFHVADGEGAVPADMVMVEAGKREPSLMLPEGQFRFAYEE